MRQISGHTPIPVAENVAFLQFSYDLYNSNTGTMLTNQADGGASQGLTPNQITKINIMHMSIYSTLHGAKGYQGLDLQTSVSARDLTFKNDYPLSHELGKRWPTTTWGIKLRSYTMRKHKTSDSQGFTLIATFAAVCCCCRESRSA